MKRTSPKPPSLVLAKDALGDLDVFGPHAAGQGDRRSESSFFRELRAHRHEETVLNGVGWRGKRDHQFKVVFDERIPDFPVPFRVIVTVFVRLPGVPPGRRDILRSLRLTSTHS